MLLVDVEGWSVEEAARMLDCPVGTVKSRCFRGRSKLAKQLAYLRNPDHQEPVVGPGRDGKDAGRGVHEQGGQGDGR